MQLKVYNTITRKKEVFQPLEDKKVKMFVCGVTVQDYTHLGHARTYSFYDTLVRLLRYLGYKVTYLQNVTDVGHLLDTGEDRVIKKAEEEKKHPLEISEFYLKHMLETFDRLRLLRPDLLPKATEHIQEIIEQAKTILKNGYAYEVNGSVYFDVSKFKDYGKLSRRKPEELKAGARVEVREEKKSPTDFALWIRAPPEHILKWESPWGMGYPGWHIEDTAIAIKYFGPQYDIHGGGIDLIFPHHEAEIAQAETTTGLKPYVKYWIHTGMLTVKGVNMSKSLGNFVTLTDALDKHGTEALRLWIASTYYRKPLDYNKRDLEVAKKKVEKISLTLEKIEDNVKKAKKTEPLFLNKMKELQDNFFGAILDDLNTPLALTHFFEIISLVNKQIDENKFSEKDLENSEKTIKELGDFFQIIPELKEEKLPKEVEELIEKREEARKKEDWKTADEIRNKIRELGYTIEDTEKGVRWRKLK